VRFEIPAIVHRCGALRGLLFEGMEEGNGVLVWLHRGDSTGSREFTIHGMRDTVTPQGAGIGVRYMTGEVAHGLSLDSGTVMLGDSGAWSLRVRGSGLEIPGALRVFVAADFASLGAPADTISCEPQP